MSHGEARQAVQLLDGISFAKALAWLKDRQARQEELAHAAVERFRHDTEHRTMSPETYGKILVQAEEYLEQKKWRKVLEIIPIADQVP